jgi:hypothetical protein
MVNRSILWGDLQKQLKYKFQHSYTFHQSPAAKKLKSPPLDIIPT